jgi:hypothetical protein
MRTSADWVAFSPLFSSAADLSGARIALATILNDFIFTPRTIFKTDKFGSPPMVYSLVVDMPPLVKPKENAKSLARLSHVPDRTG